MKAKKPALPTGIVWGFNYDTEQLVQIDLAKNKKYDELRAARDGMKSRLKKETDPKKREALRDGIRTVQKQIEEMG